MTGERREFHDEMLKVEQQVDATRWLMDMEGEGNITWKCGEGVGQGNEDLKKMTCRDRGWLKVMVNKPSQLGLGRVIVEARSSDAALHHSPSWSNSPYTAWRCVLGHCPVEKQMMAPQSTPTPSQLLLHASWWEPHMQRSSVHLLCVSLRQPWVSIVLS